MPIRRGSLALSRIDERVLLRSMLLERIAAEPGFAPELRALFGAHASRLLEAPPWRVVAADCPLDDVPAERGLGSEPDPDLAAYVIDVRALAKRWGLDRFIPEQDELGAKLVHDWCRRRERFGPSLPAKLWLTEAHRTPEIGEVVGRAVTDLGDVRVVDELVRPVIRIELIDEWNPLRESRAAARKRLRSLTDRKIRDELDRLAADAEAKGYGFVDRAANLDRDLDRLVQLMAKGATVEDLITATGRDPFEVEGAVYQSARRIADRTGVAVRGWGLHGG